MQGLSVLLPQLEEVLRTQALSAMAVFEQGIYNTQDQLDHCLQELQKVQSAAEEQCSWQVQQIQEQYQQDLDALTAQYEQQVRELEQQTKERITAVHAEAEDVVTQAAAQLLFSLQPQDPVAAAATEELSLLHIQEQQRQQDATWEDQQDNREQPYNEAAWDSQQQQQQQQPCAEAADSTASFAFVSDAPRTPVAAAGQAASSQQEVYAENYSSEGAPYVQQQGYDHITQPQAQPSMHDEAEGGAAQQFQPHLVQQMQEPQTWQQEEQAQHMDQWEGYHQQQQEEQQLQRAASQQQRQQHTNRADAWAGQGYNAAADTGKAVCSNSRHRSGSRDWDRGSRSRHEYGQHGAASSRQSFGDDGRDNEGSVADAILAAEYAYEQQQRRQQQEKEEWQLQQLLLLQQQQQDRMLCEHRRARSAAGHMAGSFSAPGSTAASRQSSTAQGEGPFAAGAANFSNQHEVQQQQQPMLMRALSATEVLRRASSSRQQIEQGLVQGLKRASQASIPDSMLAVAAAAAATAGAPPSQHGSGGHGLVKEAKGPAGAAASAAHSSSELWQKVAASPTSSVLLQGSRRAPVDNSILKAGQHSGMARAAGILSSAVVQRSISSRESRSSGSSRLSGKKGTTRALDLLDDDSSSD